MKLYVANCSKQEHLFTYMIPENPRPFSHAIRAGSQIEIPGNQDAIMAVIGQHQVYGMMEVNKVKKGFGGLCYRLEKPISIEAIQAGFSQSDQEMIDRAQNARNATAAAADQILANKAQEMGLKQKSGLEIEVIEEKKNAADNEPKFNQTIEVVREGVQPIKKGRGRPRS
jgi:hypothetical protein